MADMIHTYFTCHARFYCISRRFHASPILVGLLAHAGQCMSRADRAYATSRTQSLRCNGDGAYGLHLRDFHTTPPSFTMPRRAMICRYADE